MQQNLEVLKEDGLIIKKLSEKKLLFITQVLISSEDMIIDKITLKLRYKINKEGEYQLIGNTRFMNSLSQRIGVKMKNMYLCYIQQEHLDKKFRIIYNILIKDPVWVRNYKIKQILNEVISN